MQWTSQAVLPLKLDLHGLVNLDLALIVHFVYLLDFGVLSTDRIELNQHWIWFKDNNVTKAN